MHLVVAGATGATGQLVVRHAAAAGHRVTALVRDLGRLPDALSDDRVEIRQADVVGRPVELPAGTDAVVSALGKRSTQDEEQVCRPGVVHLLAAMRRQDVRRIVAVSASPVLRHSRAGPWWFRATLMPYVRWSGRRVYRDLARMEAALASTGDWCEWTVLRPGHLLDAAEVGDYRTERGENVHGSTRRPDLAAALVAAAGDPSTVGQAYGIASR